MTDHARVRVVDFPGARVAVLEHDGSEAEMDGAAVAKFVAWRRENGVLPPASATFNVVHHNSDERVRYDLCAAISQDVAPNAYGVIEKQIPAGRCAQLRHVGSEATLAQSIAALHAGCSEPRRDFPLFLQRVKFGPSVPQDEWITDLFLPLR